MATAMATQAVNEGLLRFIAERNGIPTNQDLYVLIDTFLAQDVVSVNCANAMRQILKSFRNDFHHLNPSISNVPVQNIARGNIENITLIEKEIFEHSYENGKLFPEATEVPGTLARMEPCWLIFALGELPPNQSSHPTAFSGG